MFTVTGRRCPVCGSEDSTCGPAGHGTPIEISDSQKGADMADLKVYTVQVHTGSGVRETQLRLSEADAKRRGGVLYDDPAAEKPGRRTRRASTKKKVEVPVDPVKTGEAAGDETDESTQGEPSSEAGQSPTEEG